MDSMRRKAEQKLVHAIIDKALKHVEFDGWSDQTAKREKVDAQTLHWLLSTGNYNMVEQRFINNTSKTVSNGDKRALIYRIPYCHLECFNHDLDSHCCW